MVVTVDRILDIKHRRQCPADEFTIFDGHRAIVALGHDLQSQSVEARKTNPDQSETNRFQYRLNNAGHAGIDTCFSDDPFFELRGGGSSVLCFSAVCHANFFPVSALRNKKERDRSGPTPVLSTKNMTSIYRNGRLFSSSEKNFCHCSSELNIPACIFAWLPCTIRAKLIWVTSPIYAASQHQCERIEK